MAPIQSQDDRDIAVVLQHDFGVRYWDVAIVGDGSGCGWDIGCGWACTLIDAQTKRRKTFHGAWSCGTVNIGEAMPYLHAASWFAAKYGKERKAQRSSRLQVHCITDSQVTAKLGTTVQRQTDGWDRVVRKFPHWYMLLGLRDNGFDFHFHWKPRMVLGLNALADHMAGAARKTIEDLPSWQSAAGVPVSGYSFNYQSPE